MSLSLQPMRNFTVKGIDTADAYGFENLGDQGKIAQQSTAAVALHHALGGAAQVQVDEVKSGVLDNAGSLRERLGI